jgi:hypothetical protein
MTIIVAAGALVLLFVSGIHLFWAFGGTWGGRAAVPEKAGGELAFKPGPLETAAVAALLLGGWRAGLQARSIGDGCGCGAAAGCLLLPARRRGAPV